jgi:iron complex outermembrane receptor protein
VLLVRRFGARHLTTLGGEYWRNTRLDQENYDADGTVYLDSHESNSVWGIYLEHEVEVTRAVAARAGVRYDHHDTFGGDWNPRLSLVCSPTDRTTVKLLYGGAFRAPSPYELYYHDGETSQKPSPDLGPESVTSLEAVLEQRLGRTFRATVSVFGMRLDDLIDLTTDPSDSLLVYRNTDRVELRGVELGIERRAARGWSGRASYSFQNASDAATDERLTGSPQHLAGLLVAGPLSGDALSGAVEVRYVGDRPTVRGGVADGCVVVNADVTAGDARSAWALCASVDNVFDVRREDPGSQELVQDGMRQDGRTLRIEVVRRFR